MTPISGKTYVFDQFRLEGDARTLLRNGQERIPLAHRPFQVLLYLIENRDRFVSREELLDKFWEGRDVYDLALTKAVGAIRKAIGENVDGLIETRWGEGYRFVGAIEESGESSYVEIERTREIKYILEESGDFGPGSAGGSSSEIAASNLKRFSTRIRLLAGLSGLAVLLIGALAFSKYYGRPAPVRSIAVLPLKNLSSVQTGDILADGITESLATSLSKIEGLKVITLGSVAGFRETIKEPNQIAEKLNVETFIEGSVRTADDRIRIDIRLVNAKTGEVLWSMTDGERAVDDLFDIQDSVARSVAAKIRLRLSPAEEQRISKRQTNDIRAYQAYVKGRYFWKKRDRESLDKAKKFFEDAISIDPGYAYAYAGLADYYLSGIWYAGFSPDDAVAKARKAAEKVASIDDQLPEAHKLKARLAASDWDWKRSQLEIERAIELDPSDPNCWQTYAFAIRNYGGSANEAVTAITRAQELDPLSVSINTDVGVMLTHAGRLDEAIDAFLKTLESDPQFFDAYWNLGIAYEQKGMLPEAVDAFLKSAQLDGKNDAAIAACREAFRTGSMRGFWKQWIDSFLSGSNGAAPPDYVLAAFNARVGNNVESFDLLERSVAKHEPYLVNLGADFAFKDLRSDPRFIDLKHRIGLE